MQRTFKLHLRLLNLFKTFREMIITWRNFFNQCKSKCPTSWWINCWMREQRTLNSNLNLFDFVPFNWGTVINQWNKEGADQLKTIPWLHSDYHSNKHTQRGSSLLDKTGIIRERNIQVSSSRPLEFSTATSNFYWESQYIQGSL